MGKQMKTPGRVASKTQKCRMSESIELYTQIDCESKPQKCRMSESIELYTQIDNASKTLRCRMSESIELLSQIDTARTQDPVDDAFMKTPKMQ